MDHVSQGIGQDATTAPFRSQTQQHPPRRQIRLREPFLQPRTSYGSAEDNPIYVMTERRSPHLRQQLSDKDSIAPLRRSGSESMFSHGKAAGSLQSTLYVKNAEMLDFQKMYGRAYWRLYASQREFCNSEDCPLISQIKHTRPSRKDVMTEGYGHTVCLNDRRRIATDSYLSDYNHARKIVPPDPTPARSARSVCSIHSSHQLADHNFDSDDALQILEHEHLSGPLLHDSWCIRTRCRRIYPSKYEAEDVPAFHIASIGYDGASSNWSRRSASDQGLLDPVSPHRQSRKDRRRRPTFATEGLSSMFRLEDPHHDGLLRKISFLTFPARAQTRISAREPTEKPTQQPSKSTSCPPTPQGNQSRRKLRSYFSPTHQNNLVYNSEYLEIPTLHKTLSRTKSRPVTTSEAPPVFIQPVRELVIRRWQTIRGRFGHERKPPSWETALGPTTPRSSSNEPASTLDATSHSPGSPHARARRRLARERGEIHSSDMGSSQQHDDPESPQLTGVDTPLWLDSPISTPLLEHTDPLAMAAALVNADPRRDHGPDITANSVTPSCPPNSLATTTPSGHSLPKGTPSSRGSENSFACEIHNGRSPPYSPRGRRNMKQQRSRLSEVYSPDDDEHLEGRNALSAVGSAINSPKESPHPLEKQFEFGAVDQTRSFQSAKVETSEFPESSQSTQTLLANVDRRISAVHERLDEEKDGQDQLIDMEDDDNVPHIRQGIVRMSTSGTQIHRRDAWDMMDDSD